MSDTPKISEVEVSGPAGSTIKRQMSTIANQLAQIHALANLPLQTYREPVASEIKSDIFFILTPLLPIKFNKIVDIRPDNIVSLKIGSREFKYDVLSVDKSEDTPIDSTTMSVIIVEAELLDQIIAHPMDIRLGSSSRSLSVMGIDAEQNLKYIIPLYDFNFIELLNLSAGLTRIGKDANTAGPVTPEEQSFTAKIILQRKLEAAIAALKEKGYAMEETHHCFVKFGGIL